MIKVTLKSDFPCVFSVNGALHEEGNLFLDEDCVSYITALPLSAAYLAYTVKLFGANPQSNRDLCMSVCAKEKRYLLFARRYHYVYAPRSFSEKEGIVPSFFAAVKQENWDKCRAFLTPDLSAAVSNQALEKFFAPYTLAVKTDEKNVWLLASAEGKGELFTILIEDGKIKDIATE